MRPKAGARATSLRRGSPRPAPVGSGSATRAATNLLLETVSRSPEETIRLGREFIQRLEPPCLILLEGELGSGKTVFTKGLVAGLGAAREEEVSSPSFTLVHEYGPPRAKGSGSRQVGRGLRGAGSPAAESAVTSVEDPEQRRREVASRLRTASRASRVYHVDLYRVESPREMETLGLEDLFAQPAFIIVEWGEKLAAALRLGSLRPAGAGSGSPTESATPRIPPFDVAQGLRRVRVRFEHAGPEARKITAEMLLG